jgi:hypothetical protein
VDIWRVSTGAGGVAVRIGLFEWLEARLSTDGFLHQRDMVSSVGGVGNVQVGAKLRLFADPGGVRKARGRYPRRLHRTREGCPVDAEFIPQVRAEPIARAELLRDSHREFLLEPSFHVDQGQLVQLGSRLTRKLSRFTLDVRLLRVAAR